MKLVLLYLLLAIRAFPRRRSSCLFVAAYEDFGTSIPDSSDISFLDGDTIPDLADQEEPISFLDSNLGAGDQENIFGGATAPLDSVLFLFLFLFFTKIIDRSHFPRCTDLTTPGLCRHTTNFNLQCLPTAGGLRSLPTREEVRLLLRFRLLFAVPIYLHMV